MRLLTGALILAALTPQQHESASPQITVLLLNGATGAPLSQARLLFFTGDTAEEVSRHAVNFTAETDQNGVALLAPVQGESAELQVFPEALHPCHPPTTFNISLILTQGLIAPNTCGTVLVKPEPGRLILFARRETLREKLAR